MGFEFVLILILAAVFLAQWLDRLGDAEREAAKAKAAIATFKKTVDEAIAGFSGEPLDPKRQQALLGAIGLPTVDAKTSAAIYGLVLSQLTAHPEARSLRRLALDVGRAHFTKVRSGAATLEDEQRIMNDIAVRSD